TKTALYKIFFVPSWLRGGSRSRQARSASVSRDVHEDLFEVRSRGGQIGARGELVERAVGDLAAAVHDDHPRTDLLDQVQEMRREENRGAIAGARHDGAAHAPDPDRVEAGQRL